MVIPEVFQAGYAVFFAAFIADIDIAKEANTFVQPEENPQFIPFAAGTLRKDFIKKGCKKEEGSKNEK